MAVDDLSKVFSALADPTRREILLRLGDGQATVTQLAKPFPISLPAISRHLKVLEQAGLISRDRHAQWRTSSLRAESLRAATSWMEQLNTLWDNRFDRLDAHLAALMKQQQDDGRSAGSTQDSDPNDSERTAPDD